MSNFRDCYKENRRSGKSVDDSINICKKKYAKKNNSCIDELINVYGVYKKDAEKYCKNASRNYTGKKCFENLVKKFFLNESDANEICDRYTKQKYDDADFDNFMNSIRSVANEVKINVIENFSTIEQQIDKIAENKLSDEKKYAKYTPFDTKSPLPDLPINELFDSTLEKISSINTNKTLGENIITTSEILKDNLLNEAEQKINEIDDNANKIMNEEYEDDDLYDKDYEEGYKEEPLSPRNISEEEFKELIEEEQPNIGEIVELQPYDFSNL